MIEGLGDPFPTCNSFIKGDCADLVSGSFELSPRQKSLSAVQASYAPFLMHITFQTCAISAEFSLILNAKCFVRTGFNYSNIMVAELRKQDSPIDLDCQ
jgi:hypothetical protein